jgi:putative tryptophan/tyrosine transport system substrate-binding protein
MTRRTLGLLVTFALCLLVAPLATEGQQAGKLYRIGHLMLLPRELLTPFIDALETGLRDLGYVEGRNVIIEHRSAEGRAERLPDVAAELVRLGVDVIVAGVNPGIAAAQHATTTIPIVMVYSADPVGRGFIASLQRPGGNITGGTIDVGAEMYSKNLELLREAVPGASRVAFLWNAAFPGIAPYVKTMEHATRQSGVRFQSVKVEAPSEFERAFAAMAEERAEALVVFGEPLTFSHRGPITELAARSRLPAIYPFREFVDAGGLMSYGPNLPAFWWRAASYVDKILKGAKPAELPVERPMKFELVINLKTAQALGLTIPPTLLFQADEVIR